MTALLSATHADAIRTAADFAQLQSAMFAAAREVAGADGATLVLRDGEFCFYAAEDAIAPLWAGQRFPVTDCISGWAMLHRRQTVVTDIEDDERIPLAAYRPTFVRSLAMTPVGAVGAVGVYWSHRGRQVPADTLAALTELADEAARTVERLGIDTAPWAPNFTLRAGA